MYTLVLLYLPTSVINQSNWFPFEMELMVFQMYYLFRLFVFNCCCHSMHQEFRVCACKVHTVVNCVNVRGSTGNSTHSESISLPLFSSLSLYISLFSLSLSFSFFLPFSLLNISSAEPRLHLPMALYRLCCSATLAT